MNVYMNTMNGFGYSYIDWEYAKRKQDEPELSFDDVLKESIDKRIDEAKEEVEE